MKDLMTSKNPYIRVTLWVMISLAVAAIIIVVMKLIQNYQTGAAAAGDIAGSQIIAAQTGISSDRQLICKQVAIDCRSAMTVVWLTNFVIGIDSQAMINALNRLVTANEAILTSQYFRENNGFSLGDQVTNTSFWSSEFTAQAKINPTILNALT